MRVYIAGPMRGLPGHNFAAFDKVTTRWREYGHSVYSPAEADRAIGFDGSGPPPRGFVDAAILRDIEEIVRADAIAALPGWKQSRMATVEVALVRALDPPRLVYDAVTMELLEDREDLDAAKAALAEPGLTPWGAVKGCLDASGGSGIPTDSILAEAASLVHGPRRESYGHPREDYGRVALMMTAILGVAVTPALAILCQVAVKISRECHRPKRDNRVDGAGYFECLDLVS